MERRQEQEQHDPVETAIERVLKIERDGTEQLQRSGERAQQLLSRAREQAAAIGRRADACISKMHSSYLQKVERDIDRLTESRLSSGAEADNGYDAARLTRAARGVAAKLTGAI